MLREVRAGGLAVRAAEVTLPCAEIRENPVLRSPSRGALDSWASDVDFASALGVDPFRLRAGVWERLPKAARDRLFDQLERRLEDELTALSNRVSTDVSDARQTELAIVLVEGRLAWLGSVGHRHRRR